MMLFPDPLRAGRVLLFAASGVFVSGVASAQQFTTRNYLAGVSSGTGAQSVSVGDLNHDGVPDVVTNNGASSATGSVSVYLGNPPGTLGGVHVTPLGSAQTGTTAGSAFLADMNQDGLLDYVVPSSKIGDGVAILFGDGTGGFIVPTSQALTTSSTVTSACGADFNNDGVPDVLLVSYASDQFFYALGSLNGALVAQPNIAFPSPNGTVNGFLGVADVDNDGDLDWASGRYYSAGGGGIGVFTNVNGQFTLTSYSAGSTLTGAYASVNFGDIDEDGDQDAIVNNTGNSTVQFFINGGPGVGYSFTPGGTISVGATAMNATVADLDHDGHLDVVVAQQGPSNVQYFLGNGAGSFGTGVILNPSPLKSAIAVVVADMNADGQPDVITANLGTTNTNAGVTIFIRTAAGIPTGIQQGVGGTSGCSGKVTMNASTSPVNGTPTFRITTVNAPKGALGLYLLSDQHALTGDYLGIFCDLQVDLITSTIVVSGNIASDRAGTAVMAFPLPLNPAIVGLVTYNQTIWAEPYASSCVTQPSYGLVASQGMTMTIQ